MTGTPPLRIAVYHDLPSGGAKRSLAEQVRRLSDRGHHLEVFAPATAEESLFPLRPSAAAYHKYQLDSPPSREELLAGRLTPRNLWQWAVHFVRLRQVERRIAHDIDKDAFDVVLAHPSQFTHGPYVLRYLHTPSLLYCHEPMRAVFEPGAAPRALQALLRPTLGRIDRRNMQAATRVIVNSDYIAREVASVYGLETSVAYHGVDPSHFRPLDLAEAPYVMSVGGLGPLKGFDFLIDALGDLPPEQRPPFRIVSDRGQPGERERLAVLAHSRGVDVRFHHRVTDQELVRLYNRARLVLYAPHREPFGLVPLEAMACGTAVLAVPEGGVCETVVEGETGFTSPRDRAIFSARLAALLQDASLRQAVGASARRVILRKWGWDRAIDRLESALQEALAAGGGP